MIQKTIQFVRNELSGWHPWQVAWLLVANTIIIGVAIYMNDSPPGIIASVAGICCVVLVGMGKISNYIFGIINVVLYAAVAWKAKYYGDVMLNLLYYLPTNIIGWWLWSKNMNDNSAEVIKRRLTLAQRRWVAVSATAGILVVSGILKLVGGNLPLADSASTVLSVIAQFLMIKRYAEQWIAWILVNAVSIGMWVAALGTQGGSIAVLMMWSVFLVNSVVMYVRWFRDSKAA